jgi:hypothetical protein
LQYGVLYFEISEVDIILIVKGIQRWNSEIIRAVPYGSNYVLQDSIFKSPGVWNVSRSIIYAAGFGLLPVLQIVYPV